VGWFNQEMTTFYIIRHAEKEKGDFYNPRLRHQDEPISAKGKQDSQKLWSFFSDKQVSAIYVSGYLRTGQTIEFVASQLGLAPIIDERLNEMDNGLFEGLSMQEIQQTYPEACRSMLERKEDFRFPEGETGAEAQKRIADLLEEKRKIHDRENVIFVAHEGLMRVLMCHIMGIPVYRRGNFQVNFCGIVEIMYQPEYQAWKLIRFNQGM
jgi:broad specificity phosphatase PhoE